MWKKNVEGVGMDTGFSQVLCNHNIELNCRIFLSPRASELQKTREKPVSIPRRERGRMWCVGEEPQ
jgi:hypothetical protein